jgi:hypothetical protein
MNTDILNRPTLALLIDCWHDNKDHRIHQTWHRVSDFCKTNPYVQTISLTCYKGYQYDVVLEEPWWRTSNELFNLTTKWDYLVRDWKRFNFIPHDTINDSIGHPTHTHSSPIIRDMQTRPDQIQLTIANTLQLAYYCNFVNPAIENIVIMGRAWDHCLETTAVGWREITYALQYNMFRNVKNLLVKKDCVLNWDCTEPEFKSPWLPINDQFFYCEHSLFNINS